MCDLCVMESVKERMLSRRSFFKASAASAAAVTAATAFTPTQASAAGFDSVEDMTHELFEDFPTFFGSPQFSKKALFNHTEHSFGVNELTIVEHTGTHIDAPLHVSADGASVAEIPVNTLIAPLCVVDITERAAEDADTQVTPDDLKAWISANGDIPSNACVAMNSGWGSKVGSDEFRNADSDGGQHYPGFHVETVTMLMEDTGASSIASDTLSLDRGTSQDFATHFTWLPSGRFGIECLANLDKMPAAGATLVIGAPKFRGCTGGPARIFAMM